MRKLVESQEINLPFRVMTETLESYPGKWNYVAMTASNHHRMSFYYRGLRLTAPSLTVGFLPFTRSHGGNPTVREGAHYATLNRNRL